MGENIHNAIKDVISDEQIRSINAGLNSYVDKIGERLDGYRYKKPALRQKNITRDELHSRVIESFFSVRVLNKITKSTEIPVSQLSSGEKRKALIDVAHSFLSDKEKFKKTIIIGVDEPEASLHTSACFDQFDRLVKIADSGHQVLCTTHWYGFLPAVTHGVANITEKNKEDDIVLNSIELHQYREAIKKSAKETKGQFPSDISLKSVNDLVQSIMSSIRRESPYNWIICEGSSEKIYFEHYFEDYINKKNLRILPVGGAKFVKRLFEYLELPIERGFNS